MNWQKHVTKFLRQNGFKEIADLRNYLDKNPTKMHVHDNQENYSKEENRKRVVANLRNVAENTRSAKRKRLN